MLYKAGQVCSLKLKRVVFSLVTYSIPNPQPTQCGVCYPVLKGRVETGAPVGTLWHQWASVTAFGMAAAMAMPITLRRSRSV